MNNNRVCCIRLELNSCTLYVFNVYFPCDTNNNEYLQEYNDVLSDISSCMIKHDIDYCIIAGDLNTDLSRVNSGNTLILHSFVCKIHHEASFNRSPPGFHYWSTSFSQSHMSCKKILNGLMLINYA